MSDELPGLDPVLTLAQTMHSTPSAYAALLGAGVSIAAGAPSAWGVVEALIRRLADQEGEDSGEDPASWFRNRYRTEPQYQSLLEALAQTSTERQRLLRTFFEPPAAGDGNEAPRLRPSLAHRALARLVTAGAVRVILTLNFDRLMETALREAGVEPTVVASREDLTGLAPLHTLQVVVVHLHGDYLSAATMLNTAKELESYPEEVDLLLDRVLGDYGLIAVGWSASYDPALRDAISRQKSRFFTPYWVDPFELSPLASDLLVARKGVKITATADDALGRLADAVDALDARAARHPLTLPVAIAAAKRELSGRTTAITLHDRMHDELSRLRQSQDQTRTGFHSLPEGDSVALLHERIDEALLTPCGLVATAAYWGSDGTDRWWLSDIERYARPVPGGGRTALLRSVNIPAAHLLYVAGVAAVAAERFDLVLRMLSKLHVTNHNGRRDSVASIVTPGWVYVESRPGRTPNKRVFDLHTPTFVQHLGLGHEVYQDAWETFELLRLIETTYQDDSAAADIDDVLDAQSELDRRDDALRTAEAHGANAHSARRELREAWTTLDRSVARYSRLARVDQPHLRVAADFSNENRLHQGRLFPPLIGQQLLADLGRAGGNHPLVLAGFCGGQRLHLEITVEAVNTAIGIQGNQLAYNSLAGQGGVVPDYFWFDTLDRPLR